MAFKFFKMIAIAAILILVLGLISACGQAQTTPTATSEAAVEIPKPSNAGGPGEAVNLTGNATEGANIYAQFCATCHGDQGKGGVANSGSDDGTIPPLNPIDPGLVSSDNKTFTTNVDLFIEHGSTPEGDSPEKTMPAWGDNGTLTPQQIADVTAYIISLNK